MSFNDSTIQEINDVMVKAQLAFEKYRLTNGKSKAEFLRAIAQELDDNKANLIQTAVKETNLPEPRIGGEFARTTGQLRMFATLVEEGSWVEARVDTALPDRAPMPKPDIRKMLVPIGSVVVFGASNFPFAYSTAGGDTASALAAGCPVVIKAHPAHAQTSQFVAECIDRAIKKTKMPEGTFGHIHGKSFEAGKALVQHPLTKAVGFTGSYAGGKALYDLANERNEPIPVFSEMGSINPVFLLPSALKKRSEEVAKMYAASITLSAGQFCTNPGLLLGVKGNELSTFANTLGSLMKDVPPSTMLHPGIASSFYKNRKEALNQKGVQLVAESPVAPSENDGRPTLATVSLDDFINNEKLREEVFGPYSLLVQGNSVEELNQALDFIPGQLTATIIGDDDDLKEFADFIVRLREKAGRIIINGVPTGVEVCPSMHHGGPFPSTTDSRFTSVGADAIKRFARPVSFQNFPSSLLPDELKNENPLNIWRLVNSSWTKEKA